MTRVVTASMISKILGAQKPILTVDDDHTHGYHYSLVQAFVTYMAHRDAGFDLDRFVREAGYTPNVADDMRLVAWAALTTRQRTQLGRSIPYACRARAPWWRHLKKKDIPEVKS